MNNIAIRTSAKPFIDRVKFPYGFKKSGDFSISEANLLSLYGRTLNALETGELQAESEDEKQKYIQEIIKADMEEAGNEDVFRKIKKDFQEASFNIEDSEIRDEIEKALNRAKEDFK